MLLIILPAENLLLSPHFVNGSDKAPHGKNMKLTSSETEVSELVKSSTTEQGFSVRYFLDYLGPCFPFCQRSAHSTVEEAQLFTVPISQCPTSERLFIYSGLFEMLLIAHPTREKCLFY